MIMGDTCNSDILAPLAMNADIIVHEATNAWIRDQVTDSTSNLILIRCHKFWKVLRIRYDYI